MKIKELLNNYINHENPDHQRKAGRFWASDIWAIRKGYLTPRNFFKQKIVDELGIRRIIVGEAMEKKLQEILEFNKIKVECQKKYEVKINKDIVLVVKPDFEFSDFVIETKFPFSLISEIPDKWKDQLEAEHRATSKKVYLGILSSPFNLKLPKYTPSSKRWEEIKQLLIEFNKKLKSPTNS